MSCYFAQQNSSFLRHTPPNKGLQSENHPDIKLLIMITYNI